MSSAADNEQDIAAPAPRGLLRSLGMRWFKQIRYGRFVINFADGARHIATGAEPGPNAEVTINRNRAILRMIARADVGAAEGFIDGDWTTPDLRAVLDFFYVNEAVMSGPMTGRSLLAPLLRLQERFRANTKAGSKRNIAYHYDVGNPFYRLWLDPTMTYSSALFTSPDMTLEEGQLAKYRRVVETLGIGRGDRVLEIGCGWGGFAEFAARETGCRVVGITLSQEQANFAAERIRNAGLADRVDIRIQDYRDVTETFDKVVSIEMFEAVGEKHWPVYFQSLAKALRPGGAANLQIITVADARFPVYRKQVDFVRRYVFPGGLLPPPGGLAREIAAAGLRLEDSFYFGDSYAETLHRWQNAFADHIPEIASLGYDERFRRMWWFYLCGCEASFRSKATDVGQFIIRK